jgi:hypothetical protein
VSTGCVQGWLPLYRCLQSAWGQWHWRRSNTILHWDTKTWYICIAIILHQDSKTKYMFVNITLCHIT